MLVCMDVSFEKKKKKECVNQMKSHERCEQDTIPLRRDGTTSDICCKVFKLLFSLKKHMVLHKNLLQVSHQVIFTFITTFVCHLYLKVCKTAAGLKSHLRGHSRKENANSGESRDGNHL